MTSASTGRMQPSDESTLLDRLDADTFTEICELLLRAESLRPLSETSRRIREACMPMLFRHTWVQSARVFGDYDPDFLPRSLWPHIQRLTFYGIFPESRISPWVRPTIHPSIYAARALQDAFEHMPKLNKIKIFALQGHGVPWLVLETILSNPRLRSFDLPECLCRSEPSWDHIPPDPRLSVAAPLQYFRYTHHDIYRRAPRSSALETLFVSAVTQQASQSLETLITSSEMVPSLYDLLASASWPNLRELRLVGERAASDPALVRSYPTVLANAPKLQTLVLDLAPPPGATPRLKICPPRFGIHSQDTFPWPELLKLSIAYPDPDDALYAVLPHTLRSLALRCWPRHYIYADWLAFGVNPAYGWQSPILTSTELLSIIESRAWHGLSELDIEYAQDEHEERLLRSLAVACPNLTNITLHRYRSTDADDDIDITMLAQSFAPLTQLRDLRLHLNFVQQPFHIDAMEPSERPKLIALHAKFHQCATDLASALAPSLRSVSFLNRVARANYWTPFRIYMDQDKRRAAVMSDEQATSLGLDLMDFRSPPLDHGFSFPL
ncbi:hypothetical protein FKP32DRAFT_1678979 [Trametes sanguinea]|nr:hypothetical protein FKP32DRAFT_1678979 [Trametes sanguinea]